MDLSQIGESLIGKKVEGTVDGVKVRGTVTRVSEDEYGSTVLIQTDKPTRFFEADDDYETGGGYKSYNKIALTKGEMRNFQLVSDSNKKFQTMKRIKDGYSRGGYDYLKEKYDEYILIFNEGRNYGIYNDDAYKAAEVLGVDVDETTKSLVFPFEKLDEYLPALVRSGNKCVVVEDGFKNPVSDSRRVNDSDYYGVNAQVFIAFNDGEEETGCEICEQHNYERGDIEGHHYEIETEFDCYDGIAVANIWFDVDENTEVSTTGSNAYSETIDNMLWKMFENWGIRQIVADFQYDIDADSNEWIGDSRVKDATQYSYGGRDWGGRYDEDFENADEDYETAIDLMNGYMRLEEEHGIDWKGKETVDTWKNFFYDVIEMAEKFDISDPKYIYDELEDANFHSMNWCLCISGILGADFQNEAIDWFSKKFVNKKVGKRTSYDYSTSDVRLQALWQIIQEMGLI